MYAERFIFRKVLLTSKQVKYLENRITELGGRNDSGLDAQT